MSPTSIVPDSNIVDKGTEKRVFKEKTAKQILAELWKESLKERYPSVPVYAHPQWIPKDNTSSGLQKCVITLLQLCGQQAERISVTGRVIDSRQLVVDGIGRQKIIGSVKRIKSSMQKGSADISATIFGRSVKIEIKIGRDEQSEAQAKYQRQIEMAGGIYLLVKDFQSFYDWYLRFREEVRNE